MSTIYAYQYNNYYNRILKKEDVLSKYGNPIYMETDTNLNFNPNDNISTIVTLGRANNEYLGNCDYLIYSDNNTNISSRWFILENQRIRGHQFKVTLYRDVLADNLDKILNADCFIEKATLPSTSPLIFNQEDFSVNQIKTEETPIKDETGTAWIVGYVARDYAGANINITANTVADYTYSDLESYEGAVNLTTNIIYKDEIGNRKIRIHLIGYSSTVHTKNCYTVEGTINDTSITWSITERNIVSDMYPYGYKDFGSRVEVEEFLRIMSADSTLSSGILTDLIGTITDAATYSTIKYNNAINENGKVLNLTVTNPGYYKIDANISSNQSSSYTPTSYSTLDTYMATWGHNISSKAPDDGLYTNYNSAELTLSQIAYGTYTCDFPNENGRLHLKDAPYDMFCIPYGNIVIKNTATSWVDITLDKSLSLSIAQGLATELASNLYDLQLLPYCPMTGFNLGEGYIDINSSDTKRYTIIEDENNDKVSVLLWSTVSSTSKIISANIPVGNTKIENQCDFYRLVSPNYNGQFEYNNARNKGTYGFNIDITYKPYQPYIHINPVFSGLYGQNYQDARGLICGGDFSIAYTSDRWAEYQVQNKNYQNIFDREVQNMEVRHTYDMVESSISSIVNAAGAGIAAGKVFGPGVGIVAGALSLAGGAADLSIKEALFNETLDYKKDMFGYQLDNIKALPQSIAKSSAYTQNNKIFPILEKYTCTSEEKEAFAKKVAWNGMKVGVIGRIADYINNTWAYGEIVAKGYIKAKIIRIENFDEDYHFFNTIAEELNKGIYIR